MRLRGVTSLVLVGAIAACAGKGVVPPRDINAVLTAHRDSLLALPGVVGTAVGLCDGERCIKVLLSDASAAGRQRVPERLEGFRVVVEVSGTVTPR